MTKSTITRDRLEAIAYGSVRQSQEEGVELARMALAAMDSEPVAWTWHHLKQWHVTNDEERARDLAWDGVKVEPLYRHAQPAPVVPDAATAIRACLSEFPESARDIVEECADIAENACRAAMLQAEPVCTCPSGDGSLRWPCPVHAGNSPAIGIDLASGQDRTVEVRYVAPPGYVMVPKEPTEAMMLHNSGCQHHAWDDPDCAMRQTRRLIWSHMLAAAPQEVKGE